MSAPRLVLDTNVCLDLFVFRDPCCAPLFAALQAGKATAVTRADCRNEWLRVLEYPNLPLDPETKRQAIAEFDAFIAQVAPETRTTPLPACRDRDDQKFLELARDASAQCLVTKDKALLKLAGKLARSGLFDIKRPEAWAAEWCCPC